MQKTALHSFHIPVMGLSFSIDSPLKVAQFGIASVLSLSDDSLIEQMRQYYSHKHNELFTAITPDQEDYRARRITGYLNLIDKLVQQQIAEMQQQTFSPETNLTKYFTLLPDGQPLKKLYLKMLQTNEPEEKAALQIQLKNAIRPGSIDVNIMTKLDKTNYTKSGETLPSEYTDALAALRGFASSTVSSSVIFSAGMNMRLYGYLEQFPDFYPDASGVLKKKVVIKVSDYRSAFVQGKIMAKKGIWVSEFRIESGLNCGGHAFATDGFLMGPIMEEFKQNREKMQAELWALVSAVWATKNLPVPTSAPDMRITVQGGIGTAEEHNFLLDYYGADATGWGTPFLLVPEATTVDDATIEKLTEAKEEDLYLSPISPLGVPFNSLRNTNSEKLKLDRIAKGKPGSPCEKKHLVSSSEFADQPLCTASRKFQRRKLEQLQSLNLTPEAHKIEEEKVLAKECLCEGLSNTAMIKLDISRKPIHQAVAICPGPNLAYFSKVSSLQEMVDHIYGRGNVLNENYRPHMFIKELQMYLNYWENLTVGQTEPLTEKQLKYNENFRQNLLQGIAYYNELMPKFAGKNTEMLLQLETELTLAENRLTLHEEPVMA